MPFVLLKTFRGPLGSRHPVCFVWGPQFPFLPLETAGKRGWKRERKNCISSSHSDVALALFAELLVGSVVGWLSADQRGQHVDSWRGSGQKVGGKDTASCPVYLP